MITSRRRGVMELERVECWVRLKIFPLSPLRSDDGFGIETLVKEDDIKERGRRTWAPSILSLHSHLWETKRRRRKCRGRREKRVKLSVVLIGFRGKRCSAYFLRPLGPMVMVKALTTGCPLPPATSSVALNLDSPVAYIAFTTHCSGLLSCSLDLFYQFQTHLVIGSDPSVRSCPLLTPTSCPQNRSDCQRSMVTFNFSLFPFRII